MPIGPEDDRDRFEDFESCVSSLSGDMSEEEARQVCGRWQQEVKEAEENQENMSLSETASFSRTASLTDSLSGEPPYIIHGVAIGPGDVTVGQSGKKKLWPGETLQEAAGSLSGRPLVRDHINTTQGVIGTVIDAKWKEGVGVLYEAELIDREIAEKIHNGLLEVSARIKHPPSDKLETDEQTGALRVSKALFDNLSVVPTGAAPSNEVDIGPADDLSAAELAEEFGREAKEIDELAEHQYHVPEWDMATKIGWDKPTLEDFGTDNLDEISQHYLVSETGFPPENFSDLKLPVVDENGTLNLRALRVAKRSASQISGVEDEVAEKAVLIANVLIRSNFPNEPMTAALADDVEFEEGESETEIMELEEALEMVASEYDLDEEEVEDLLEGSEDEVDEEVDEEELEELEGVDEDEEVESKSEYKRLKYNS